MTDHTNDFDQAERIRRLQARRAASSPTPRPRASTPRRRHPAAATRWLLAGLSIASFFTVAGTVAAANVSSVATQAPAAVSAPVAGTGTQVTAPTAATPAAPSTKTTTPAAAHTTTRGS